MFHGVIQKITLAQFFETRCTEQALNGHVVDCYCYCLVNMDDSTGCLWSGYGTMGTDYSSGCSQAQFSH